MDMRRWFVITALIALAVEPTIAQGEKIAERLDQAIRAAGVPIVGVSIADSANKATWTVQPSNLQTAAQPYIDAFTVNALAAPRHRAELVSGALSLDLATSRHFVIPLRTDVARLEFTNTPSDETAVDPLTVTLVFDVSGPVRTVTWPRGVRWVSGAPTFGGGDGAYRVTLRRYDGDLWLGIAEGPFQ